VSAGFHSGALVISLDFELYWGVRDSRPLDQYRENLLGARQAVPALLEMFRKYNIHATWATVGFLFCRTREEALAAAPAGRPQYRDRRLCPYRALSGVGADEQADPFHYAASLLETIRGYPFQEIASHTFSHYYCREPGQDRDAFEEDLKASIAIGRSAGVETRSLVFPRNQVEERYLSSCARLGIKAYRGNPRHSMYQPGASAWKRLSRFADSYIRLSGDNSFSPEPATLPVNIPASRFLRPYNQRLAVLDGWRLRRISRDLTAAAAGRRIYHLWWHPHNFGANLRENLAFLEGVLRHFEILRSKGRMESLTMAECADRMIDAEEVRNDVAVLPVHA
jgi:peptidoglycan/xylan/chitin deacetylase (PgdA/CDA1 family)